MNPVRRVVRQLGTWGTGVALAPFLWLGACALARVMAQHAYDMGIVPKTKAHRVLEVAALPAAEGPDVRDPKTLAELQKYLQVWSLEPGACEAFPDAARFPWTWNPFRPSALMLRLRQKQAFLLSQRHAVRRSPLPDGTTRWDLAPDPEAALGGRRFLLEARGDRLLRAVER